jgi:hypothetical protein
VNLAPFKVRHDYAKRLRRELVTYASAFVIATAFIAEHQTLQTQPVFWRRLAAAAHAALVTRTLGENDDDQSLFVWAMRMSGETFYFSVLNDAPADARVRAEFSLTTLVYNLRQALNILGVSKLLAAVAA